MDFSNDSALKPLITRIPEILSFNLPYTLASIFLRSLYTGRTLEVGHQHLKITHDHFDEVAEILKDTLEDAGMSTEDIETVMGIVGSTRNAVVFEEQ